MFQAGASLKWLTPVGGLQFSIFSPRLFGSGKNPPVTSFLDVEANANDSSYQLWQGMLAFGVGMDGVGLGMGRQQMHFYQRHT